MPTKPKKVSQDNVKAAIQSLKAEGDKITNQAVKDKLGGGSLRDIAPLVRKVKAELEQAEAEANAVPEVPEEVRAAAEAIWVQAYRHAEGVAAAERRDKAAAAARHEAEMTEADEQLGALEAELEATVARAADLEQKLEKAEAKLNEQRLTIAALEGRLAERDALTEVLASGAKAQASRSRNGRKTRQDEAEATSYTPNPDQLDLPMTPEVSGDA